MWIDFPNLSKTTTKTYRKISQILSDPEQFIQLSKVKKTHTKSRAACGGEGRDVKNLPYICSQIVCILYGKVCYSDICLIMMISKFTEGFAILENSSTHNRQKT